MADGGAEPGVEGRLQRGDAGFDACRHRLAEVLGALDIDPVALQAGKGVDGEIVAAGGQAPGQRRQRLAFDVDHRAAAVAVAGHGAFGGARDVEQDRHRKVALLRAGLAPDAVVGLAGGKKIDPRADRPVRIKLVAVRVASGRNPAGTQSLELAFDGADTGGRARIVPKRGRAGPGFDQRGQHPDVGGKVGARPHIPFGVGGNAGKCLAVHVFGGEVESAVSAGWRGLGNLAEGDFVLVVGGLLGVVVSSSSTRRLRLMNSAQLRIASNLWRMKLSLAVGLIGVAAARAVGLAAFALLGRALGGAGLDEGLRRGVGGAQVGPERHRAEGAIAARGPVGGQVAAGHAPRPCARCLRRQRRRVAEQVAVAQDGLDRAFGLGQGRGLAQGKGCGTEIGVKRAEAGRLGQRVVASSGGRRRGRRDRRAAGRFRRALPRHGRRRR